ncbi:MAG: bifunctional homocysteine S-methyltransferase/methylenetetrahydrofolate reductase [Flavobacteriales bacterium]|nr:MAG: bifunctional homocysteine S-methyltransferase/methylenetetrahydrofolate reductase [Bacteroidota bacterium]MBE2265205.1 bifunctional homocysteine S-methyltransferase/methylenetetrahydrofolate reductase [Flavobacteriales bacterium]MBZ0195268.1 bifunctional homocysteine S-methyltransferase/methylenetetrahydrofolate reductase [Candidatus Kapabacteria bacterium]MCL4276919.1 bifunctional homocysteine S-methyltransferase/methylenetetrahydrofolate reductase [Ignavibacteria bacterium]
MIFNKQGSRPFITDGSMAVELAKRGFAERPPDRYNLSSPTVVERIYHEFIQAGATLLQTNTLFSNRFALESVMLSARVAELNRKGVWLARTASAGRVPVLGVIGPTGRLLQPLGPLNATDAEECFREQAASLLSAGCDAIALKSFIDITELEIAISAVRAVSTDVDVIALKSFPEDAAVLSGPYPKLFAKRITRLGIQAFGSNGTVGPQRMVGIVDALVNDTIPLVAIPDVGIPTMIGGTAVYHANPEYVGQAATRLAEHGASIVGADGGATVEHIAAIAQAVASASVGSKTPVVQVTEHNAVPDSHPKPPTQWYTDLQSRFMRTVELDIPRGLDMSSVIEGARYLHANGIDAVNISDGARARLRMNPISISRLVMDAVGIQCITHMACRDRNMVGLQSDLLGAHELDVRNILAVTGDPTHIGDFPYASSVYDVDSIGMIRAMDRMNHGNDLMGNPLGSATSFSIACAVNPAADDIEREVDRLAQKAEQGAMATFSQPVFDDDALYTFLDRISHIPIKFIVGIIPLRNLRHAEFLHFEVPGMHIPSWVRKHMLENNESQQQATSAGIHLAVQMLSAVKNKVHGVYLMPPFKKYSVAVEVLQRAGL